MRIYARRQLPQKEIKLTALLADHSRLTLATIVILLLGIAVAGGSVWNGYIFPILQRLYTGIDYHHDSGHYFFLGGYRSVMCARNTGLFVGVAATCLWLVSTGRARASGFPAKRVTLLLILLIVAMVLDGLNALASDIGLSALYPANTLMRLGTGLLAGVSAALLMSPILNGFIWRVPDPASSLTGTACIGKICLWLVPFYLAVILHIGLLALPVALLTSTSTLFLFGALNLTFYIAITGRENRYTSFKALAPTFVACVLLGLAELWGLSQITPGLIAYLSG